MFDTAPLFLTLGRFASGQSCSGPGDIIFCRFGMCFYQALVGMLP